MKIIHRIDPYLEMGPDTVDELDTYFWKNDAFRYVDGVYEYWAGMIPNEPAPVWDLPFGTKVGLYADNPADPSVYFLTFVYPDSYVEQYKIENEAVYPKVQVDLFFVIRDDVNGPHSDISEVGGNQCRDCGRVNCTNEYNEERNLIVPVWRQALDGAHVLCDDCANMEAMRKWCTERDYEWDDEGPISPVANSHWNIYKNMNRI